MSNISKYNNASNFTSYYRPRPCPPRGPDGRFISRTNIKTEKPILQNSPSYIRDSISRNNAVATELSSVSSAKHFPEQHEQNDAIIIPDGDGISRVSDDERNAIFQLDKPVLSRQLTPKQTPKTTRPLAIPSLQKSLSDSPSPSKITKDRKISINNNVRGIDGNELYDFNECIDELDEPKDVAVGQGIVAAELRDIDEIAANLRGHFGVLPEKTINIYNKLNEMAAEILSENSYAGIQMFFVLRNEGKHPNGKPKISYKIIDNPEFKEYTSKSGPEIPAEYNDVTKKFNKYKKKIKDYQDEIRVRAKPENKGSKSTGLDEIFQTSETMEFFCRSAGLIEGVKPFSNYSNGKKYTWLDCQRDFRVPTGEVIFINGSAHIGALYSEEGGKKALTKGQDSFHSERNVVVIESKNPFAGVVKASKYMRYGDIHITDKSMDESIRIPSTAEFLEGKMYISSTYNVSGADYSNKEQRERNVDSRVTSLRNKFRDIHLILMPLARQDGDAMSHYSLNTVYSERIGT